MYDRYLEIKPVFMYIGLGNLIPNRIRIGDLG
jgi:hypothetical protein